MTFASYYSLWIARRELEFPASTVSGDKQRARDYLLPFFGNIELKDIRLQDCKKLLMRITEPNFKSGKRLSRSTRDHCKALLSAILSAAINEADAEIQHNPCRELRFSERRTGKRQPRHLADKDEIKRFIDAAKQVGNLEYLAVNIFLMTGCRKQEVLALRWKSIDWERKIVTVAEKLEQVTNQILPGTKSGSNVTRQVPIPQELVDLLYAHKHASPFNKEEDFLLTDRKGDHLTARKASKMIESVRKVAGLDVSAHSLRHSYGRLFIENGGNVKILQSLLGHSSSATTDLYSSMSGRRIENAAQFVTLNKKGTT